MADISIDMSGVISAINRVSSQVATVSGQVSTVNSNIGILDRNIERVRAQTMAEIERIKKQLAEMDRRQVLAAALQRAISEVIRVRQELEQKFGTHKAVRDNMMGILQATDLSLITKTTISRCTEELMISAPKYWLAPALIALAAWISDNKPLADRAVKEAIKRDEEKTCLLFALITRRVNAGRIAAGKEGTNVCFKWLERYFSLQDPTKMRSSIIAYVDAYTNGVFGNDEDNLCRDHISHWMDVLMESNPNFAEEQKAYWVNVFNSRRVSPRTPEFNALQLVCNPFQFAAMDNYLSKINASERPGGIKAFIGEIIERPADKEKLLQDIDDQLMKLVSNYEEEEVGLRDEERYLQFVKQYEGDEARARNSMNAIYAGRKDDPVDFAKRLSQSITDDSASVSAKKTALNLLGGYISGAFNEFITASKGEYPTSIDLRISENGGSIRGKSFVWNGSTEDGSNRDDLVKTLEAQYEDAKKSSIAAVTDEELLKQKKKGTIIAATLFWTVIGLFVGLNMRGKAIKGLEANAARRANLKKYYDNEKVKNVTLLNNALNARKLANETVYGFQAQENSESIVIDIE